MKLLVGPLLLTVAAFISGCGLILGDQDPGIITRMACSLVVGVAIGYGIFRWQQHGWRTNRRERRDERRDNRG